jgi:hypothetical protein
MDRFTYGPGTIDNAERGEYSPPAFTRQQLQFLAGAVETFGMVCYDAGFYYAKNEMAKVLEEERKHTTSSAGG